MTARIESLLSSRPVRSVLSRPVLCSQRRSWMSHPRLNLVGRKACLDWRSTRISARTPDSYVDYTRRLSTGQLQSVIAEYQVSTADPNRADPTSERQIMIVDQPFDNHNGGQLAFGPDGFLYIAFGDGGSGGDPLGNGQKTAILLGKILRIAVDPPFAVGKQNAIPRANPFLSGGGLAEFWPVGFPNPLAFSFGRADR